MRRLPALLVLVAVPAFAGDDGDGRDPGPPATGGQTVQPTERPANRLAKESSPYLLQHAHNPVDWYPWGDEAFEKARKEGKPIFLSIGYSTCHWCHVMERESFEDEDVAAYLNEHFVAVKVDREERPDVDAVYMAAVQATAGQGGWPLSVFLTPDRKPFFGGTYFPPTDRYGRPGFPTVLRRIEEVWRTRREDVLAGADQLVAAIARGTEAAGTAPDGSVALTPEPLARAMDQFRAVFDARHGGFGPAPKFPRAFALSFQLERARTAHATERDRIVAEVETTLEAMRRGGLHDQIGGGFHRYSTDPQWLVPHFEKMLYDQAFLVRAYVDAWLTTRDPRWEATARGAIEYVLRDLRDPAGGFRSAEDADSEGEEGKFYVWTEAELGEALGAPDAAVARELWQVHPDGNFRDEATGTVSGANILHLEWIAGGGASQDDADPPPDAAEVGDLRTRLLATRSRRVRPHLDDKVLADWNGMMIGAMARAGAAFGEPRYVTEAARAADFVLSKMRGEDGTLLHRWRAGDAGIPAFLDDHAFLALGLADLYEATFEARYLRESREMLRALVLDFRDPDGAFALASHRGETLVARPRELYDGAIPSGNSAAALALLRVGSMTGDADLTAAGEACLRAWMPTLDRYAMGYPFALTALAWALGPTREVVIAGDPADAATQALVAEVRKRYLPDTVVLLRAPGEAGKALEGVAPFVAAQGPVKGADGTLSPAAWVCRDRTCAAPVTTPVELAKLLDGDGAGR